MNERTTDTDPKPITIFTIGFVKKTSQEFFEKLQKAGVKRVIDVRLNNVSQLAGFTKRKDLEYFLRVIAGIDYAHTPNLAPTKEILDDYKKKRIDWPEYEARYNQVLEDRRAADDLDPGDFDMACLLCSEATPEHCHRRLVAEHLHRRWGNVAIKHL